MHDLLALQALDTEADQLRHRMANLPERIEVDAAKRAEDEAAETLATLDEQRHDLGRQQKRFDDEISSITSHVEEVEATLYGGTVRAPSRAGAPPPFFAMSFSRSALDFSNCLMRAFFSARALASAMASASASPVGVEILRTSLITSPNLSWFP